MWGQSPQVRTEGSPEALLPPPPSWDGVGWRLPLTPAPAHAHSPDLTSLHMLLHMGLGGWLQPCSNEQVLAEGSSQVAPGNHCPICPVMEGPLL